MSHLVTFVLLCLLPQTTTTRTEETLTSATKGFKIIEITKDKVSALEDVPLSDVDAVSVHGNAVLKSLIESKKSYCIALRDRGVPVFLYAGSLSSAEYAEKTAKESGLFGPTKAGFTDTDYRAFTERPWAVVPSVANARSLKALELMAKSPFPLGIVVHGGRLWRDALAADGAWPSLQQIEEAGVPLLIFTSSEQLVQDLQTMTEGVAAQGNVLPRYDVTFQYKKYADFCSSLAITKGPSRTSAVDAMVPEISATASEWIFQPVEVSYSDGEEWDFGPNAWKLNDVALREDVKTHFGGVQKPDEPEFFLHGSGSEKDPRTFKYKQLWTVAVVDGNQDLFWPTKSAVEYQIGESLGEMFRWSYAVKKSELQKQCRKVIGFVSVWRKTKGCAFVKAKFGATLGSSDMKSGPKAAYARINYGMALRATGDNWPDAYVFPAEALKECGIHLQYVYKLRAPCPKELGQPSGRA